MKDENKVYVNFFGEPFGNIDKEDVLSDSNTSQEKPTDVFEKKNFATNKAWTKDYIPKKRPFVKMM